MARSKPITTFSPDPTNELNLEWTMRQFWRIRNALEDTNETTINVVRASANYTAQETDIVILADPTSASFTITLKAGQDSRFYYVKNINTTNTNTVTIDPNGSELIDDGAAGTASTYVLNAGDAIYIIYDSDNTTWWFLGHMDFLHPDVSESISVGYPTSVDTETYAATITPDFSETYLKKMTVTGNFTIAEPAAGQHGHCEYLLTIDASGPYTVTAGTDVTIFGNTTTLYASKEYSMNIRKFSDTADTIVQIIDVTSEGAFAPYITEIDSDDTPYTLDDADVIVWADPDSGATPANITINLPTGQDRRIVTFKHIGSTSTYTVTLDPNGTEQIEDDSVVLQTTFALTQGESLSYIYRDSDNTWRIW